MKLASLFAIINALFVQKLNKWEKQQKNWENTLNLSQELTKRVACGGL